MISREPGQLLGGKYRLIRQLGAGGMGSVWLAHHQVLNAPVALKFISLERLDGCFDPAAFLTHVPAAIARLDRLEADVDASA